LPIEQLVRPDRSCDPASIVLDLVVVENRIGVVWHPLARLRSAVRRDVSLLELLEGIGAQAATCD
jgi:hypothetical protein